MKNLKAIITGVLIIAVGVVGGIIFVLTKPQAERKSPPRMTPIAEVEKIEKKAHRVRLELMGTVVPAETIELKARVIGEITRAHKDWIEGGRIPEGEEILKIEDKDYAIALKQAQSELVQAQSELMLETGKQDVARREWDLIGRQENSIDSELALRVPQLKSAQAREKASAAKVEMVELNLKRTSITAPFNALVVKRNVNRGDQASVSTTLGTLVNIDRYHVIVSISVDQLKWIELPGTERPGSRAEIILPDGTSREGEVIRLLADLEESGRMARLLVEVPDPLNGDVPMLLNSFVRTTVTGVEVPDAYCIKRRHFRESSSIWLFKEDKTLHLLPIKPVWSDRESVIFKTDIPDGEQLIVSDLGIVIDGMDLRLPDDKGDNNE